MRLCDKIRDILSENSWTLVQTYFDRDTRKTVELNCLQEGVHIYSIGYDNTQFIIKKAGVTQHQFKLRELSGCCGVIVSYNEGTNYKVLNQGIAKKAEVIRQLIGQQLGYSTMISTITQQNNINQKVKKSSGYNKLYVFNNDRTGNEVILGVYDLNASGIITKTDWNMSDELEVPIASVRYNQVKKYYEKEFIKDKLSNLNWFQKAVLSLCRIKIK